MEAENMDHRLFIGGLSESITSKDLLERFNGFGVVSDVVISTGFAHLTLYTNKKQYQKCITI